MGSKLLNENSGTDKQSQQRIAETLIGTLITAIAVDEHSYRPRFELPGNELNGTPYYPLDREKIFNLCEFD